MGHFPTEAELSRPEPEERKRIADRRRKAAVDSWAYAKDLASNGEAPYGADKASLTCPDCYARVNFWHIADHEGWHRSVKMNNILGPGLF